MYNRVSGATMDVVTLLPPEPQPAKSPRFHSSYPPAA
jgi:hypothetical protein